MKNNSIFLIVIAVLIVIFHEFILATGYICYISAKYLIVSVIPETFNRVVYIKDNNDAYNNYIDERYGVLSKIFKMHTDGRFYSVSAPFIEKEFSIQIHKGNIESDNFYEVLSRDNKFQHLYSEWVKKQVGIEDVDVELKIAYNQDNLDFKQIKVLSEDYREIFELLGKFEIKTAYIKNVQDVNEYSIKEVATNYYNTVFKTNEVVDNMPYYVILIRDNCNLLEFLKHRSGEYCSCLFENGKFVDYKYYNN